MLLPYRTQTFCGIATKPDTPATLSFPGAVFVKRYIGDGAAQKAPPKSSAAPDGALDVPVASLKQEVPAVKHTDTQRVLSGSIDPVRNLMRWALVSIFSYTFNFFWYRQRDSTSTI